MKNWILMIVVAALACSAVAQKTDECCMEAAAKAPKAQNAKAHAKQAKSAKAAPEACCEEEAAMAAAKQGEDECCQSTPAKKVAYGAEGCCNNPNEVAKFKVYVVGKGYVYYGCEDSAKKGRASILAKNIDFVGPVQKVSGKRTIGQSVKA